MVDIMVEMKIKCPKYDHQISVKGKSGELI